MESEHQPLASASTTELYSHEVPPSSDSAFGHESRDVTSSLKRDEQPWFHIPKRYVIAIMAFLGFGKHSIGLRMYKICGCTHIQIYVLLSFFLCVLFIYVFVLIVVVFLCPPFNPVKTTSTGRSLNCLCQGI